MTTNASFSRLVGALVLVTLLVLLPATATAQVYFGTRNPLDERDNRGTTYTNSNTGTNNNARVDSGGSLSNSGRITTADVHSRGIVGGGALYDYGLYNQSTGTITTANVWGGGVLQNSGTITNAEVWGNLTNNGSGKITDATMFDGSTQNNGVITRLRYEGGKYRGGGHIGTLTVAGRLDSWGGTGTVDFLTNNADGFISWLSVGNVASTDRLNVQRTAYNNGTIGTANVNGGTLTNRGEIIGDATVKGGVLENYGGGMNRAIVDGGTLRNGNSATYHDGGKITDVTVKNGVLENDLGGKITGTATITGGTLNNKGYSGGIYSPESASTIATAVVEGNGTLNNDVYGQIVTVELKGGIVNNSERIDKMIYTGGTYNEYNRYGNSTGQITVGPGQYIGSLQIGKGERTSILERDIVLTNNANVTFNFTHNANGSSPSLTHSNAISGAGSLTKTGNGTLALTGVNTYSGGTSVDRGLINFNNANNFGTGRITLNGGGLQWASGNTTDISARLNSLGTNGATFDTNGNNVTLASGISGAGSLTKSGTGKLTLSGANAYTGGTTVGGSGTLALSGNGAIASSNGVWVYSGATFDVSGITPTSATIRGLSDGGSVVLGAKNLNVGSGNTSTTFFGVISGTGSLTKSGTGTLTLSGANTYTGGTTVSAGTLQIGSGTTGAVAGNMSVASGANVTFNRSNALTYSGAISGAGSLTKNGTGTLILTGNNTYSGGTTVSAGTLQIGDGGATGTLRNILLNNNSNVTFNFTHNTNNGVILTHSGVISGSGSLTKTGTGYLALTGKNTYTGGTTVSGGTLRIGSGTTGSITGNILNNAGVQFFRSDDITYGGVISGTGMVTKDGAGTLTLTGNNIYTGRTHVRTGTLQIGDGGTTGSIAGNITNDSNVAFNRSDAYTYSGVISGTGSVTKNGTGALTLSGKNTYTGDTLVNAGTLDNRGTINRTTVNGGTFANSGTVNGTATVNTGTFTNNTSGAVGSLAMLGGTVNNGGWIGDMIYSGGTFNGAAGYIDSLTLAGFSSGNSFGTVENLAFVADGSGYMTIAGFVGADGELSFMPDFQVSTVDLAGANLVLDFAGALTEEYAGLGFDTWTVDFANTFENGLGTFGIWGVSWGSLFGIADDLVSNWELLNTVSVGWGNDRWAYIWMDGGMVNQMWDVNDWGVSSVPEPATLAIIGLGLAGLGLARRKRKVA